MPKVRVHSDLTHTQWPQQVSRRWIAVVGTAIVVGLLALGWWTSEAVEESVRQNLHGELTTILNADTAGLEFWLDEQRRHVRMVSEEPTVRKLSANFINSPPGEDEAAKAEMLDQLTQLRELLQRLTAYYDFNAFAVADPSGQVFVASHEKLIGQRILARSGGFMEDALIGRVIVSTPFKFDLVAGRQDGPQAKPFVFAAAPIYDESGRLIAALALGMPADVKFTHLLEVARSGESGETYAFDRHARLISESRFDEQLHEIGLLAPGQKAILNIRIHDPEGDLTKGYQPKKSPEDWPRTAMAIDALEAAKVRSDDVRFDLDGYRDYRGVKVIGAWKWLPEYNLGVTTEVDLVEAYRPLYRLRAIFGTLFLLLFAGLMTALMFAHSAKAWQQRHQRARKKLAQLGQYTLEERIGRGGMGEVFLAQHALMRRPTAIKLLRNAQDDDAIARFEREVHHTSLLTHPNTIAVYDFGFTTDGTFYYAMEFLDGATSKDVVAIGGPMPESRVIHVLTQVCGSLAEAHNEGLVHRDVKPANIMLCNRGGIDDFVKVLDFGLVKDTQSTDAQITGVATFGGTPHFMSPEAVRSVRKMDARSDIYALGAVAYYLLTGQYIFDEENLMTVCMHHCETEPIRPSVRVGHQLSPDLESLVLRCLEKDPADRPQTADGLREALLECDDAGRWTEEHATAWWSQHGDACRDRNAGQKTKYVHAAETIVVNAEER